MRRTPPSEWRDHLKNKESDFTEIEQRVAASLKFAFVGGRVIRFVHARRARKLRCRGEFIQFQTWTGHPNRHSLFAWIPALTSSKRLREQGVAEPLIQEFKAFRIKKLYGA